MIGRRRFEFSFNAPWPSQNNLPQLKTFRKKLRRKSTYSEKILWQDLRNRKFFGAKFYRQFSIGPYIFDFYCHDKKLAIELDGISHTSERVQMKDRMKAEFLQQQGIQLLRFEVSIY